MLYALEALGMEFPNIYKGNYKMLAVVPILLILVAIYFIPRVPEGIDFKGGILITMQTNQTPDTAAITSKLAQVGITDASVSTFSNPLGNVVEVQIGQDEKLKENEANLKLFGNQVDSVQAIEAQEFSIQQSLASSTSDSQKQILQYELASVRDNLSTSTRQMRTTGESILKNSETFLGPIPRNATSTGDYKALVEDSATKATEKYQQNLVAALNSVIKYSNISFQDVSPTLSELFIQKVVFIVLISAVLTVITVFVVFRSLVPSIAVLSGATSDVLIALGAMGLFQIPLSLPSFAALLMLVGFSLDTDMLLTIRTIKRSDHTARERAYETMKTGTTMTMTAIVSFTVLLALSLLVHISTYFLIASVAISGLIGDLFATWFLNGAIILWYLERKGEKQ